MNRSMRSSGIVAGLAAAATLVAVGSAAADPVNSPGSFELPLACDDGSSFTAVVTGNGEFTPGHDTASNANLVPTGFGEFNIVITDDEGNVLEEFTEPAVSKGNSTKDRRTSVTCTFGGSESFTDPHLGVLHATFEGSVIGFVTPAS